MLVLCLNLQDNRKKISNQHDASTAFFFLFRIHTKFVINYYDGGFDRLPDNLKQKKKNQSQC